MSKLRALDIWRCAIVKTGGAEINQADLVPDSLVWLPQPPPFAFRADPFGVWDGGKLHIFVEHFDYRTRKGAIEVLVLSEGFDLVERRIVLSRPWHLSYPFTFRTEGDIWMLPEARQSGKLTLYRARHFPAEWEEAATLDIDPAAVDATPLFYEGRWWMFYGRGGRKAPETMDLNIAFAERLTGPWTAHPQNPVRRGLCSRPAGIPLAREDGLIVVPMQDSQSTYGAAVRRLTVRRLDPRHFEADDSDWLKPTPALAPHDDGLHTICAAGEITLIDCKRIDRSLRGNFAWNRGRFSRHLAP